MLPQSPLKSQTCVAVAQDDEEGSVTAHAGSAGGGGAGVVLLKVSDQLFTVPVPEPFLLSSMQRLQVPSAFCPLLTAPR